MTRTGGRNDERILILAPTGRDGEIASTLLRNEGLKAEVVRDVPALAKEIEAGAAAAILTHEALAGPSTPRLAAALDAEPPWSELPLLLFAPAPLDRTALAIDRLGPRAQVTLLERPIHVETLMSSVRTALRSRARQYQIRDLLETLQVALERERVYSERVAKLVAASIAIGSNLMPEDILRLAGRHALDIFGGSMAVARSRVGSPLPQSVSAVVVPDHDGNVNESADGLEWQTPFPPFSVRSRGDEELARIVPEFDSGDAAWQVALVAPFEETDARSVGFLAVALDRLPSDEEQSIFLQLAHTTSASLRIARLYQDATQANRAKDEFLATLSHELRTPMTTVLGWTQMLRSGLVGPENVDKALGMVESSTQMQARLVEDLLDVSRIVTGKLSVELASAELRPLVENVVSNFAQEAADRGVKLIARLEEEPLALWADSTRIQQVVWNLVSNALKFTTRGGTVEVELYREKDEAVIRVTDDGEGIPPSFLPFVFERFRQADSSASRPFGGLGLGLAIVRSLVEMHDGNVTAESEGEGRGSRFTVRLPVAVIRRGIESKPLPHPGMEGRKILVVEDDGQAGEVLADLLRQQGFEVQVADGVRSAIEMLRHFPAELVISDIAMPGEDGLVLVRKLRQLESDGGRSIPKLAISAYGRPEDHRRILESGFDRFFQKPIHPEELVQAAADLILQDDTA